MKISAKGDYACRALLELALEHDNSKPVQIKEIARRQKIPEKYLVQILVILKGAGLVTSKRGVEGGYMLSRSPAEISLGEVVKLIDGPLVPVKCNSDDNTSICELIASCPFHSIWEDLRGNIANMIDNITYEDLCNRAREKAQMYHI